MRILIQHILLLLALSVPVFTNAQKGRPAYRMLVKRYGNVAPWGKGYIVKANDHFGFADTNGRFIIPLGATQFDTLLNDRAYVAGRGRFLIDDRGTILPTRGFQYILINRKKRLLAEYWGPGTALLCNDRGELLNANFNAEKPRDTRIYFWRSTNQGFFYGVMTPDGDTILSPRYTFVDIGTQIICATVHDTARVFDLNGKLLSSFSKVHSAKVLRNHLLLLEKYQEYALARSDGKVLTPFHYYRIEELRYSLQTLPREEQGNGMDKKTAVYPKYLVVNSDYLYHGGGLIDTNGQVVLPPIYENLELGLNGWFILEKANENRIQLVDDKFQPRLAGRYNRMSFTPGNCVIATYYDYPYESKPVYFDMIAGKAIEKLPDVKHQQVESPQPGPFVPQSTWYAGAYRNDTLRVNDAGSIAIKRGGHWGILSITGDTILPFVQDSIISFGDPNFYQALRKGKYACLDGEGRMTTPQNFTAMPIAVYEQDSVACLNDHLLYSYKQGHVRRLTADDHLPATPSQSFKNGMTWLEYSPGIPFGLYNRQMRRLAKFKYPFADNGNVTTTGLAVIADSLNKHVAVIDTNGQLQTPWLDTRYNSIQLFNRHSIVFRVNASPLLYKFGRRDTTSIEITPLKNRSFIYKVQDPNGLLFVGKDSIILFKDADSIKYAEGGFQLRIHKKWGIFRSNGEISVPDNYDSLRTGQRPSLQSRFTVLYKNGNMGLYDGITRKMLPAIYDTILFALPYYQHFIAVTKDRHGHVAYISDEGVQMTTGEWGDFNHNIYPNLNGLTLTKGGIAYQLFPALGDTVEAVRLYPLDSSYHYVATYRDGAVLVRHKSLLGIYDPFQQRWKVPAEFKSIDAYTDGYYFGMKVNPETVNGYTRDGKFLFSVRQKNIRLRKAIGDQWSLRDGFPPIINSRGKIIVPDSCTKVEDINTTIGGAYIVQTRHGYWMLIDTSGKVLVPPTAEEIMEKYSSTHFTLVYFNGQWGMVRNGELLAFDKMYECEAVKISTGNDDKDLEVMDTGNYPDEQFFVISNNHSGKYGLVNSEFNEVVPCIYDEIYPAVGNGLIIVRRGKRWALCTTSNKMITTFKYDSVKKVQDPWRIHSMQGM